MTPEELMKPRYQVIADYPDNKLTIGDILMQYVENDTVWRHRWSDGHWADITVHNPSYYPHLFKKLEWWEEREKYFWSDGKPSTPLFVSNIAKTVFGTAWGIDLSDGSFALEVNGEKTDANLSNYIPATREEYDNYINSKA